MNPRRQIGKSIATRPVRSGPPPLRRFTAGVFAKLAKKIDYVDPNLVARWPEIVGAELADLCLPGRMTGQKGGKTLEVFAANGAAAARASFEAETLRAKVNDYLGPGVIARISVRQTGENHPKPPPESAAQNGPEPPLQSALGRFRASISAKARKK